MFSRAWSIRRSYSFKIITPVLISPTQFIVGMTLLTGLQKGIRAVKRPTPTFPKVNFWGTRPKLQLLQKNCPVKRKWNVVIVNCCFLVVKTKLQTFFCNEESGYKRRQINTFDMYSAWAFVAFCFVLQFAVDSRLLESVYRTNYSVFGSRDL